MSFWKIMLTFLFCVMPCYICFEWDCISNVWTFLFQIWQPLVESFRVEHMNELWVPCSYNTCPAKVGCYSWLVEHGGKKVTLQNLTKMKFLRRNHQVAWWQLWSFIVRQANFNRFLHPNENPKRIFWYLVRPFDWKLSKNGYI